MNTTLLHSPRSVAETVSWTMLPPGAVHAWNHARGLRIEVEAGRIWLTEEGDADDHFLSAGGCHVVRGDGRVVIEADDGPRPVRVRCTQVAWPPEVSPTAQGDWTEIRSVRAA